MRGHWRLAAIALLLLVVVPAPADPTAPSLRLGLPVRCTFGRDCLIQQYADHDSGPGAVDYHCGPMSYDGHDGTDFRVVTAAVQRRGVDVLASAAGIVRSVRDGMDSRDVRILGPASVAGRECGNGVLIAHPNGWETQYCHLARGSVRVRTGDSVAAGATLGLVGESGNAAFPHIHLSVRKDGVRIDPFTGEKNDARCGAGKPLWSPTAMAILSYRSPDLLDAGFAAQPITMAQVQQGVEPDDRPSREGPALIAFARVIGLRAGDRLRLTLMSPEGATIAHAELPELDHDRAEHFMFVGVRRRDAAWKPGKYAARIEVVRGSTKALTRNFSTFIM